MRAMMLILVVALALSCSKEDGADGAASITTGPAGSAAVLEAMEHDCLQYRVGKDAAGNDTWNADFVYFYLVDEDSGELHRDADGRPLASGLLYHQAIGFMEHQPEIANTGWSYRIQRVVQHVRDGKVVENEPHVTVDDEDIWDLVAKDRAARADGEATIPSTDPPGSG